MTDQINLQLDDVHALAIGALSHNGCDTDNAMACADLITAAERDRCHSHGLFRLPWYCAALKSGRANGAARPSIDQLAPSVLRVDGDAGFAPLAQETGFDPLIACARESGIAALAITNMFHVAAMWPEVERLAEAGLCAFAFTASYPFVAPAGGSRPLFGTNPMGFSWPRDGAPPLVFDQASASMARGEIQIAARDGKSVPETAGIGPDGAPTTDPNAVLKGAQLGFGGYKGAALAMMIELLAGPLIGEFLSLEAIEDDAGQSGPPKGGELIIAMDPSRFGDADGHMAHGEVLFDAILAQDGARLPSARRYAAREETKTKGIFIPAQLHRDILALM